MANIVLTGTNGFIGTNLLEKILKANFEDIGLENIGNPKFSNFDKVTQERFISAIVADLPSSLTRENARRFAGSARVKYVDYENLFETTRKLLE